MTQVMKRTVVLGQVTVTVTVTSPLQLQVTILVVVFHRKIKLHLMLEFQGNICQSEMVEMNIMTMYSRIRREYSKPLQCKLCDQKYFQQQI